MHHRNAERRIRELEAALRPFAGLANPVTDVVNGGVPVGILLEPPRQGIVNSCLPTLADCRRARDVLNHSHVDAIFQISAAQPHALEERGVSRGVDHV